MAEQVKIGIIGTSGWADIAILPMFSRDERAKVVALCGRNRERAEALAAKFGVPQVFTDYRQMIAQGQLDAVVVATPDDTHYAMTMAVLDAGLHVICEKPIAFNLDQAQVMRDQAELAGVRHMVMFTWHWLPQMQRLKQLVDEGRLGKIYHADFQWLTEFWRSGAYHWRIDAAHGNGIVSDLGAHMFHLALLLLGDVTTVSAQLGFHVPRVRPDGQPFTMSNDSARVTLDFVSGAQAQIEVSAVAHVDGLLTSRSTLYGEKGTLEGGWTLNRDLSRLTPFLRGSFADGSEAIDESVPGDTADYLTAHPGARQFIDAIVDGTPLYPGLDVGYQVQQIIDAALKSHETGCRVAIVP